MIDTGKKIRTEHLKRKAYLYVRQSSLRQVRENTESTERQYALRQRAIHFGWAEEQIVVIDDDQAQSAAGAEEREGFKRLVSEVGMEHAGIVMGLEVSRLARSCSEWHKLLEICALTDTLILDEDGLYDATQFNDRLLLGLKGAMSEAELHVLRARLRGGALNAARKGDLNLRLPTGYVRDATGKTVVDPDQQIQNTIRLFFDTFREVGSATGTVRVFRDKGIKFPTRIQRGPNKGTVHWAPLFSSRAIGILHNPCYAGAYVYGRTRLNKMGCGCRVYRFIPREEWLAFVPDAHEGYILWEEYEKNQKQLASNIVCKRKAGPPREGPALLQGLVVCGVCGARMSVIYHQRKGQMVPHYVCPGMRNTLAGQDCQSISGDAIDDVVGEILLEIMSPAALEVALQVQEEVETRLEEVDRIQRQDVERCHYEADLARRRYMNVDPDRRLVADTLEAEWHEKLQALALAQEEYDRRRQEDHHLLTDETQDKVLALATDFPRLWNHPDTSHKERKRLARLILEDVTLIKGEDVQVGIRFKGGATRLLSLPKPLHVAQQVKTSREVVQQIDQLFDHHTASEIAAILNERGLHTGTGLPFTGKRVNRLRQLFNLKSRLERLQDRGLLTLDQLVATLGFSKQKIRKMRQKGTLNVHMVKLSDMGDFMYEPPEPLPAAPVQAST